MKRILSGSGHDRGFTLVELLVVLAVAAILLAVGVPGYRTLMDGQRLTVACNDFFTALNLARSEAIGRGASVSVAPSDSSGNWEKGWVVFVDENNNRRPDQGERIIFTNDALPKGITIRAALTDSTTQYLMYTSTGRTRTGANNQRTQFGTITFKLNDQVRKIKLNFLGRPRICNPAFDGTSC